MKPGGLVTRTAGDVLSEITMTRTTYSGALLVVEGSSDSKFFRPRIQQPQCDLIIAGSKSAVCGAVAQANIKGIPGVVGVIDDDYDSICGVPPPGPYIKRLDARDLETMILTSAALERLLIEAGDQQKIAAFETMERTSVREALVSRALIFGKLRLLSRQHMWNIDFSSDLKPFRFADWTSWSANDTAVISTAASLANISVARLESLVAAVPDYPPSSILHGRDTLAVLSIGLRNRIGNRQAAIDDLSLMLRLAFDKEMAESTEVFKNLRAWETKNVPYRLLN